jgi:hypothetical protein
LPMQYSLPARGGTAGRSATVLSPQPSPETLPNIQLNQRPMRINQQRSCSRRVVATWPRSPGRFFVRARQSRSHPPAPIRAARARDRAAKHSYGILRWVVRRAADPRQRGAASVLQTSQPRTIASQVDFFLLVRLHACVARRTRWRIWTRLQRACLWIMGPQPFEQVCIVLRCTTLSEAGACDALYALRR